ncbi:MAG: AAA family ATPase [Candidatus Spechtbacterales bacterium]
MGNAKIIIAVVGLPGSGKSEAVGRFEKKGFERVGFNDVVMDEVERRGLEPTQENERPIREELRRKYGMDVMAVKSMPKIEKALADGKNVVIDSFYSWESYKTMKKEFGDQFRVLAIYAPASVRYKRLEKRPIRPLASVEAKDRDYSQIEALQQASPIAMADWTIQNIGTIEEFHNSVDNLINNILTL